MLNMPHSAVCRADVVCRLSWCSICCSSRVGADEPKRSLSASSLFGSFFYIAHDEQDREGVGDARSASSAALTTMCTVGNYFWLLVVRSSGAGRGDRRRGCFLTSREGGGLTLVHCGDMDGSAAMEGGVDVAV